MQIDKKVSFQINVCTSQDIHLCGHPHWAYLLKAIEVNYGSNTPVFLFGNTNERVQEFQDFTTNEIVLLRDEVATKTIVFRDDFPLLTVDIWQEILHTKESITFILNEKEIVKVIVENSPASKRIILKDKYNQLQITNPIDAWVAETLISKDVFPYHPIRLKPPFQIFKAQNNKPRLLFSAPYDFFPSNVKALFEENFDITYAFNAPAAETIRLVKNAEIWVTGTCPPYFIDKEIFGKAENLKIIASPSTGINHIHVKEAEGLRIKICSIKTSDFLKNIHASSEHTFALLLAMVKKIPLVISRAKLGEWREKEHELRSIELNGRTIGIIGYGRIGSNLARYCHAFGMKILAFDPFKTIAETYVTHVSTRDELLINAEIVSINYHLNPETENSFGEKEFDLMQHGSYFLNTARGEIVDEMAMINNLKSGKLKAAAVDVITNETQLEKWNHPVIKYARENSNLIVTPHTAGLTIDSESKAAIEIFNEIKKAFDGNR
jgi:D-3-phosphoglycerate dehydrogenase / 2-oxoglutarate reductase